GWLAAACSGDKKERGQAARAADGGHTMDPAYLSAFAALAGSAIGGLTSLATSGLKQYSPYKTQRQEHEIRRREDLYKDFIEEASKLYVDACEHDAVAFSNLVKITALINRMRVLSSQEIIERADGVMRLILETYLAPAKTLRDVPQLLQTRE